MANKTPADPSGLSTRQLKGRRRRLVRGLSDLEGFVAGTLTEQRRRCGKEGCRWAQGEMHGPYVYLSLGRGQRGGRLVYVPAGLAEVMRRHVELSEGAEEALAEVSAINVELLARRELD